MTPRELIFELYGGEPFVMPDDPQAFLESLIGERDTAIALMRVALDQREKTEALNAELLAALKEAAPQLRAGRSNKTAEMCEAVIAKATRTAP
jgi:hypothetical protein